MIDELQKTQDYELTVAEIDVDEKQEKILNVFLNNASAQGSWDAEALQNLILDVGEDKDKLGFDRVDLEYLLPEMGSIFGNETAGQEIEKLQEMRDSLKEPKDTSEAMRAQKASFRERATAADDTEFFVVVVFEDKPTADKFLRGAKLPLDERYVDGRKLATLMDIDLEG